MKAKSILWLMLFLFVVAICSSAITADQGKRQRMRIGVEIQDGFQSCLDAWTPLAAYLSKEFPQYRFVIVPLASRRDLISTLDKGEIEFTLVNPALNAIASQRFETVPLATMTVSDQAGAKSSAADYTYTGSIIRRADRADIQDIRDINGQTVSAVKPWSLTGWIAQWQMFVQNNIFPSYDLKKVIFEGSDKEVIQDVLDGTADVGAVDTDLLMGMLANKLIPERSLYVINRQGQAVPLTMGADAASTPAYPRWVFAQTAAVSDQLGRSIAIVLMNKSLPIEIDGMTFQVGWTISQNYTDVRRLLRSLLGPNFALSAGYPPQRTHPVWFYPMLVGMAAIVALVAALLILRSRYWQREQLLKERLEETRSELFAIRAERQRIDAILALAGCGIDIVDEDNRMIYADASLERRYGDWRGKKCHEYYCDSDVPCEGCQKPDAYDAEDITYRDINGADAATSDDPHARVHVFGNETVRLVGIPFRDEGVRWLYARLHVPQHAFAKKKTEAAV